MSHRLVHLEPERFSTWSCENCSECGKPTRYWLTPHTPLCPACAAGSAPVVPTIAEEIAEYNATKNSSAAKLLHRVLDKITGLRCPHCGNDVNITLDSP